MKLLKKGELTQHNNTYAQFKLSLTLKNSNVKF